MNIFLRQNGKRYTIREIDYKRQLRRILRRELRNASKKIKSGLRGES